MPLQFQLDRLAAWPENLASTAAHAVPPLAEMPAMMRRRVDRLGKMALQVAYWVQEAPCPLIFASRHGDIHRSVELLETLARAEPLSPTAFSLSVHNAIGALYSIARRDTTPYTAIAAGEATTEAAFMEAIGLLADGAPAVNVVIYEDTLPACFADQQAYITEPHAWACRLTASVDSQGLSLTPTEAAPFTPATEAPDLAVWRFLQSNQQQWVHHTGNRAWLWQRHV